jgi:hypothetical protein
MFEVFAHNLQDANLNVVGFTLTTLAVITEELERAGLPLFQKLLPLIMAAVQRTDARCCLRHNFAAPTLPLRFMMLLGLKPNLHVVQ